MTDILAKICAIKRAAVARRKRIITVPELEVIAKAMGPGRGFAKALSAKVEQGQYALIAEIKKASPSAGLIRDDFDPAALAIAYAKAGAACLSVLTEEAHFQGDDSHLRSARGMVNLPVIRKDFTLEPYQVVESRAVGADCILLIMAALSDAQAAELDAYAQQWGLDVLIEVHDEAELARALKLKSPLIGVNNRNLKTLVTDLSVTERLAKRLPKDRMLVSESGLKTPADLTRMARCGAKRFLIGESLMKQTDVEAATRALLTPQAANA